MASTSRLTFGAVLGTVTETASAVTAIANTITVGVGMANSYVREAAFEQQKAAEISRLTFEENLYELAAQKEAERKLLILNFTNKSPQHAALYEAAYNRLVNLRTKPE